MVEIKCAQAVLMGAEHVHMKVVFTEDKTSNTCPCRFNKNTMCKPTTDSQVNTRSSGHRREGQTETLSAMTILFVEVTETCIFRPTESGGTYDI